MNIKENITEWNGFRAAEFEFEGREAILVFPNNSCEGNKWLLKTEYFGAFPAFEIHMLERGYYLAYVANKTRWMVPEDVDAKAHLAEYLHERYGLHKQCFPVGMSCGGLHAVYFAAKYPEYVAAMYIDAPVMNLLSCPGAVGRVSPYEGLEDLKNEAGLTLSDLINYRNHPIDNKEKLLKAKIPIIIVAGDDDVVVPYHENGQLFTEYYKANGGTIVEIIKPGCGHHPHGLEDDSPIIEFAEKYYR